MRPRARSNFPQINIDLIAGMLGETESQLARLHRAHARPVAGQRHHLPDGAAVQHDDQRRPAEERRTVRRIGRRLGHQAALGARSVRRARARRAITSVAPTPRSRIRRGPSSSIATGYGKAPTCSALVSPRLATSTACMSRTSTSGRSLPGRNRGRRYSARPRLSSDRRRAPDSRVRAAAEARRRPARLLRAENTASTSCRALPAPLTP